MFGKGKTRKSANDSYVMSMGVKAGNLKQVTKKAPTEQPMKYNEKVDATSAVERVNSRQKMGSMGQLERELKNP